jgi:hypothetical protein
MYRNEALDENLGGIDREFSNKEKARKQAIKYMEQNTGCDIEVEPVKDIISRKLYEKTSRHPKDSWGVRNDKRNQEVDNWEDTQPITVRVYDDEVVVTANIYHYLTTHLKNTEYTEQMTCMLHRLIDEGDMRYLPAMEDFTGNQQGTNTYNRDNILSQDIQNVMFDSDRNGEIEPTSEIYDMNYIALQIHQGADARGGYTKPVILEIQDIDYFIMGQTDITATTTDEEGNTLNYFSDDAGYHWYEGDEEGTDNWEFKPDENKVIYGPSGEEITFGSTAVQY